MAATPKFIVLPFKKARAGIVLGEMRQASNAASAERIAASMACRFTGAVALAAIADNETGELTEARLLASHGEIGDLSAIVEFCTDEQAEQTPLGEIAPAEEAAAVRQTDATGIEPEPVPPLVISAASLILTAPPEPESVRRTGRASVRRPPRTASSAGPLFEQEPRLP